MMFLIFVQLMNEEYPFAKMTAWAVPMLDLVIL